ncbi:uncharacterized protein DNG_09803 [Cephalotrichum gorgonifer]|uniref:Uncharacterized protein n=1 Tax=Cephalotrichum gorgonifer TaxID=2041049 RepID=A0AAE8SZM6_9PEZI|nr:uncharacterized protein DNG_09803 [Cephalotrichum gorgonifer]
MCYSVHSTYVCTPAAPSDQADPHTAHTTVLCARSTPCASHHWETRTQHWPFHCPNCTGEDFIPRARPVRDVWATVPAEVHTDAVDRYVRDYLGVINAYLAAHTATSSADDFLRWYTALYAETLCREHGEKLFICECHGKGEKTWQYNAALDLRSHVASVAKTGFINIPDVAGPLAGSLGDELKQLVASVSERCPALRINERDHAEGHEDPPEPYIHECIPPHSRLMRSSVFADVESTRRLNVSLCARDFFLRQMQRALAPEPYHVARVSEEGMRLRAQLVRTFSVPVIMDAGLSPHRAGLVLERLASLHLDPTFFQADCPADFDETRALLGEFARCASRNRGEAGNALEGLGAWFTSQIAAVRREHAVELELAVAMRMSFDATVVQMDDKPHPTWQPCPLAGCKRGDFISGGPGSLDPRVSHVQRVMTGCYHILGRACAFRAEGEERVVWRRRPDGTLGESRCEKMVWRCPFCMQVGVGIVPADGPLFALPWAAAVDGTMEKRIAKKQPVGRKAMG